MPDCPHRRPWYLHPTDRQPSHWWCASLETVCTAVDPEACAWRKRGFCSPPTGCMVAAPSKCPSDRANGPGACPHLNQEGR